jgi:hypothetical protein
MRLNWPQTESTSDIPYYSDEFSGQLKRGIHEINELALIIKDNAATEDNVSTVVCFLLGNSPASEFYMPTFRNTLSVPSS